MPNIGVVVANIWPALGMAGIKEYLCYFFYTRRPRSALLFESLSCCHVLVRKDEKMICDMRSA
jgi:hypothetical protein